MKTPRKPDPFFYPHLLITVISFTKQTHGDVQVQHATRCFCRRQEVHARVTLRRENLFSLHERFRREVIIKTAPRLNPGNLKGRHKGRRNEPSGQKLSRDGERDASW